MLGYVYESQKVIEIERMRMKEWKRVGSRIIDPKFY